MNNDKFMIEAKESFFRKIFNKIKYFFRKNKDEKIDYEGLKEKTINDNREELNKKSEFLNGIKIQDDSELIYLKMKLENGEIRAIDLADEQIDALQKIYDEEIAIKKEKIRKLKGVA